MAMSDCPHCCDTPCTCGHMYWFMNLARLERVVRAARQALGDRRGNRKPPGTVQEELERRAKTGTMRAADFDRRWVIPVPPEEQAKLEEALVSGARLGATVAAVADRAITDALAAGPTGRCGGENLCRSCALGRAWNGCGKDL